MDAKFAASAALAGGLIPVMGVVNARLGVTLGNPLQAPVVLLLIALTASLVVGLSMTMQLPDVKMLASAAPIEWIGGLIVCFYVFSATLLAPRMGIGNFILFAVSAQIIAAAAIDYFGWFGVVPKEISAVRAGGILLLMSGLVTTQLANKLARTSE